MVHVSCVHVLEFLEFKFLIIEYLDCRICISSTSLEIHNTLPKLHEYKWVLVSYIFTNACYYQTYKSFIILWMWNSISLLLPFYFHLMTHETKHPIMYFLTFWFLTLENLMVCIFCVLFSWDVWFFLSDLQVIYEFIYFWTLTLCWL